MSLRIKPESFPPSLRLRKRRDFLSFSKENPRLVGRFLSLDWKKSPFLSSRIGITASRRFGMAHERNRFKRLVRNAFRISRHLIPEGIDLNIIPRSHAKGATFSDIQNEMIGLIQSHFHCSESDSKIGNETKSSQMIYVKSRAKKSG